MRVAIIPARGGSSRIPRKNIRLFHGKPIIAYSIEAARACGLFDHVVVSTDDEEIMQVALDNGAGFVERPQHLAMDDVGTQEVMRHAIELVAGLRGQTFDHACCIYATAPLMTADDIKHGYVDFITSGMEYALVAGWYYWGNAKAFGNVPIDVWTAVEGGVGDRWIDINTEEDWKRAEQMYRHPVAGRLEQGL